MENGKSISNLTQNMTVLSGASNGLLSTLGLFLQRVILLGSYDGAIFIWKEIDSDELHPKNWQKIETIRENYGSVEDIRFSPAFDGFLLSSAHRDSVVLITNLYNFKKNHERPLVIPLGIGPVGCLSWNKNPANLPMLALGANQKTNGVFQEVFIIYEQSLYEWRQIYSFTGNSLAKSACNIKDVSWSQSFGRKHSAIVACGVDSVYVFKLNITNPIVKNQNAKVLNPSTVDVLSISTIPVTGSESLVFCSWNYVVF